MNIEVIEKIKNIVGNDFVLENESMAGHTTFRCGGNAKVYIIPGDEEQLAKVIKLCKENDEKYYVIGNGSNLLVRDEGYDGAIIEVGNRMSEIDIRGLEIVAQAGAKLSSVALAAMENDLAGFEFAYGIPGNVGGAVTMNAGAYGGELKDVVKYVKGINKDGELVEYSLDDMNFGYRHSRVLDEEFIVTSMCIELMIGSYQEISMMQQMLMMKRKSKQPLEYPSAGSTFKRPEGHFAGKLIEDAGLRGYQVGGAQVSEKHCGFVINKDNATATDIIKLIGYVQAKVKEQFDVELEPEVRIIP